MQGKWWNKFSSRLRGSAFDPEIISDDPHHGLASEGFNPDLWFPEISSGCPKVLIHVDISSQKLDFVINGDLEESCPVSTSKYGIGCRQDTGCTPLGWHTVAKKIGADKSIGTIFKGRLATGVADDLRSSVAEDLITSRILWLGGLQPRFNQGGQVDSKSRYIYIHGTAQEHLLGTPVSEGCIRMANTDVMNLFARVETGTLVYIG